MSAKWALRYLTRLLTGFDTTISPDEEREVRAALKSTQNEPILSRQVLGAGLNEFNVTSKEKMSILIIKTNRCQRGEMMPVMGGLRGQRRGAAAEASASGTGNAGRRRVGGELCWGV